MNSIIFAMTYPDSNMRGLWPMVFKLYNDIAGNLQNHNIRSFISFPENVNHELKFSNITKINYDFCKITKTSIPHLCKFTLDHSVKIILYVDMPLLIHPRINELKANGIRTINTSRWGFHESEKPHWGKIILKKIARNFLRNQHDHYIAISNEQKDRLIAWEGIKPINISLIKNAIDTKHYYPSSKPDPRELGLPEKKIFITSVAQCREEKRIDFLIDIAANLLKKNSDLPLAFVHVGDGKLLNSLKEKAISLGLKNNFIFVGHKNDVRPFLHLCDIFVHTSNRESFGGATAEAMACGKAIITSNVGEADCFINEGENGFKLKPTDFNGFLEKIIFLAQNPTVRVGFGAKSRAIIEEKYSWEKEINEYTKLILKQCEIR